MYDLDMILFTLTIRCLLECLEHMSTVFPVHVRLPVHTTWH